MTTPASPGASSALKTATRSIDAAAGWEGYASIFTDPVHIDFSEAGLPPSDIPREQFIAFAKQGLEARDTRQHISPDQLVEFDDTDPDKATCHSYMYARHYKKDAHGGAFYLMRGTCDNHLVRTPDG